MLNDTVYSCREKLLARDGVEDRRGSGTGDISTSDEDSGAGICQYTNAKTVGSLYLKREGQGKHPVVTLLYGT